MPVLDLEFRGIHHSHLGLYFEELGATPVTDSFPYIYEGEGWRGEILHEEDLSITSTFKVNSVQIRFFAENDHILEELIKKYRIKTRRIGG